MIKSFFLQTILLLGMHVNKVIASDRSPCDCHEINNWNELRTLVMQETPAGQTSQVDIPLCPFDIGKKYDENTLHWNEIIYIASPAHIYCKKEHPEDYCAITVLGEKCKSTKEDPRPNCGRHLFKVMSDDVWLQGLTINEAKDVVVNVDKGKKNAKIIDMTFLGTELPDTASAISAAVVLTEMDSSLEVLRSKFTWNKGTPIFNRGSLVVYGSRFFGNTGTKFFKKGGAIYNSASGEALISKSQFIQNYGGNGGYALYTQNEQFLDAGGNCFKSKGDWGCQGIQTKDRDCYPFKGTDTMCTLIE